MHTGWRGPPNNGFLSPVPEDPKYRSLLGLGPGGWCVFTAFCLALSLLSFSSLKQVSKVQPVGQIWSTAHFCKQSFTGTQTLICLHIIYGCFNTTKQSWVVTTEIYSVKHTIQTLTTKKGQILGWEQLPSPASLTLPSSWQRNPVFFLSPCSCWSP